MTEDDVLRIISENIEVQVGHDNSCRLRVTIMLCGQEVATDYLSSDDLRCILSDQ